MGCTESQFSGNAPNIETLEPVVIYQQPKLSLYEDKILIESEFVALKKNVEEAIHQTELMKSQINIYQSSVNPVVFESMRFNDEYVMDWMELDLRDGDKLLEVLMKVYPGCKEEGQKLLAESFRLRNQEASIKDYLPYFQQRYSLMNRCWADILTVWHDCDSHATDVKTDLASGINAIEDFLGKKSDQLEELKTEMRRLMKLDMHTFLTEQRFLSQKIVNYAHQFALKKQKDVEIEKTRCIRLVQSELSELQKKYNYEVTTSETRRIESESALKTHLEQKYESIIEEFKNNEKRLQNAIKMQSEDLLSHEIRYSEMQKYQEKEHKLEIEERVKELLQVKLMHKQEKVTNSMQVTKELNQLKKEKDQKVRELQKTADSYKEELQKQAKIFAENRTNLQLAHIEELKSREKVLTELKEEFMSKLDTQKSFYEEKITADRLKFQSEITALEEKLEDMSRELTLRVTLQKGFERSSNSDLERKVHEIAMERQQMEVANARTVAELQGKIQVMQVELSLQQVKEGELRKELQEVRSGYEREAEKAREEGREKLRIAEESLMSLQKQISQTKLDLEEQSLDQLRKTQERHTSSMKELEFLHDREKQALTSKLRNSEDLVRSLENQLKSISQKSGENSRQLGEEAVQLRAKLELEAFKHKKTEDSLKNKETELKQLHREIDATKREIASFRSEMLEKDHLISDLRLQTANMQKLISDLENHSELLIKQLQESQLSEENLRKSLNSKSNPLQDDSLKRYLADLSHRDAKIRELVETQKINEAEYESKMQKNLLKSAFAMITGNMVSLKRTAFALWRYGNEAATPGSSRSPTPGLSRKTTIFSPSLSEIEQIFNENRKLMLEKSPFLPIYKANLKTEKPLAAAQSFRLLENVLEQKFEADFGPFSSEAPISLPEFAIELLRKAFQHDELANQTIGQCLLCVVGLGKEGHDYADVLCRAFNIGTNEPYPVELGLMVERANAEFGRLEGQFREQFPGEVGETGGKAFLVHVIAYVYELFEEDVPSGEIVLRRLKPNSISLQDFISFNVCHCMAKSGLSAEAVFTTLDTNKSGLIDLEELVRGLRTSMNLWLAEEDLEEAFDFLVTGGNAIQKEVFLTHFDFKKYLQVAFTETYSVSKPNFLRIIGDVYFLRERQIASELHALLLNAGDLTKSSLSQILRSLDPDITPTRIESIWTLAEALGSGQASVRSILRALLTCKVGPYALCAYYDSRLDPSYEKVEVTS